MLTTDVNVVKYIVENRISKNGKGYSPKYLIFRYNADMDTDHMVIRAYGRSTAIKAWLGAVVWDDLGFGLIADYPNQWMNLSERLYVSYEEKRNDNDEFMYYIAVGVKAGEQMRKEAALYFDENGGVEY